MVQGVEGEGREPGVAAGTCGGVVFVVVEDCGAEKMDNYFFFNL